MISIVVWKSPLHILKAACVKSIVGEMSIIEVVDGFKCVDGKKFKDPIFATPSFNPNNIKCSWEIIRRHSLYDWTASTYLVDFYGYPPSNQESPIINYESCQQKCVVNQIIESLGQEWLVRAGKEFYDILTVMGSSVESISVVGYALYECGDVESAIYNLSNGVDWIKQIDTKRAIKVFEEHGICITGQTKLSDYVYDVSVDCGPEIIDTLVVNLSNDEIGNKNKEQDGDVAACSGGRGEGRYEVEYNHIVWRKFYWYDEKTGVVECRQ